MADESTLDFSDSIKRVMSQDNSATAAAIRNNVQFAIDANPEQEAQYRRLAATTQIPLGVVRAEPVAAKQQAAAINVDADGLVQRAPHLAQFLTNMDSARLIHDDVPGTANVEGAVKKVATAGGVRPPEQMAVPWEPSIGQRIRMWLDDAFGATQRENARAWVQYASKREGVTPDDLRQTLGGMSEVPLQAMSKAINAASFGIVPDMAGQANTSLGAVAGAAGTLGGFLAGPLAATGRLAEAVGMTGLEHVAGESFAKALAKDVTAQSLKLGTAGALGSIGTAIDSPDLTTALHKEVHAFGANAGVGAVFGAAGRLLPDPGLLQSVARIGGIQSSLDLLNGKLPYQGIANWDNLTPAEKGDAAFNIMLNGYFGLHGAGRTSGGWFRDAAKADVAAEDMNALQALSQLSAASKLRERDPAAFKQFVDSVAEDGVSNVYVDAAKLTEVFNQAGIKVEDVQRLMPEVAAQINEAVQTKGDVRISLADYATHLAGTPADEALLPNLKTAPDGMTYAQSQEFQQSQTETLKAAIEQVTQEKAVSEAVLADRKQVYDKVLEQLNAAGRFTPDVNKQYAALQTAAYTSLADRLGISAGELMERHPLTINAERVGEAKGQNESGLLDDAPRPLSDYESDAQTPPSTASIAGGQETLKQSGKEGPFGPIFDQFKGDAQGAIAHLMEQKNGEAIGALTHPELGDIDLVWGKEGDASRSYAGGYGLAKIVAKHPEVLNDLQNIVSSMSVTSRSENRAQLESADHKGAVRLMWDGVAKKWLMTTFEKDVGGGAEPRTDTLDVKKDDSPSAASETSIEQDLKKFYQSGGARGAYSPERNTITLLKDADLSTFLHESGHQFLEMMGDIAAQKDAPAGLVEDFHTLLEWMGVKDADTWRGMDLEARRDAHEQFARGFEAYLMEGKAPSVELSGMFSRFRSWLIHVYKSLTNLNVELTPEVRGVLGRLLATDEAIKQAEQVRGYEPLFKSAEAAGMPPEEFADYQKTGAQATLDAIEELQRRSLRDMKWLSNAKGRALKAAQAEADSLRKAIKEKATEEVMAEPVNRARTWLTKGEMVDEGGNLIKASEGYKLNSADVKRMYPEDMPDRPNLARLRGMMEEGGVHPDIAAEKIKGFSSGRDLLEALLNGENAKDKIAGITDQRMLEQHGDLSDPTAIERAAESAIHNEVRARFVATELRALAKAVGPARAIAEAAKQAAEGAIAAKKLRDIQVGQYTVAEAKAARNAEQALAKGDTAAAASEKRAQLLNNRLVRAARDALTYVEKSRNYLAKFDKPSIREKLDGAFLERIDEIRGVIDLRKNPSGRNPAQESLFTWAQGLRDLGYEPQIADWIAQAETPMHFMDATYEQFRGIVDAVKSLEHIARETKQVMIEGKKVAVKQIVGELVARMDERGQKFTDKELLEVPNAKVDGTWAAVTHWLGVKLRLTHADLLSPEFKINRFDMHDLMGPFRKAILNPILEANYRKVDLTKRQSDAAGEMGEKLGKEWQKSLYDLVPNDTLVDPDLGGFMKITRGRMLGIARHVGNESNFEKLIKGYNWSSADVWAFLDKHMTAKDWAATQAHWDSFDPLWKESEEMIRRQGGVPPPKIPAREFQTRFGTMRGGYSPIDYDPLRSKLAVRHGEFDLGPGDKIGEQINYRATTTQNSSMIARAQGYSDRINLDFRTAEGRIRDTIHDLAYREALLNVGKIVNDAEFRQQFMRTYGREEYAALVDWLRGVRDMNSSDPRNRGFEKAMQYARQGVVITGIGYRLSTVLKHGGAAALKSLGYLGTGEGAKYFAARVARMGSGHLTEDIAAAREKFSEIRTRMLQMDRDYKVGNRSMYEAESWQAKNDRFGHAMVAWSDALSAVPTAWAAYDLAITSGVPVSMGGTGKPMTEAQAVSYANSVVRQAHGSALESTRSNFLLSSNGMKGFFGALYGFMNNTYGQTADMLDKAVSGGHFQNNPAVAARLFATLLVPAVWTAWLTGGGPADDEPWYEWTAKAIAAETGAMVPFVRDAVSLLEHGQSSHVASMQLMIDAVKSGVDIRDEANGKSTRIIQDLSNAIGEWAHIAGLGQLGHILQYARDVSEGQKHPESTPQAVKEAVVGGGHHKK